MQQELGGLGGMGGFGRAPRRNPFRRNMYGGGGMDFQGDMGGSSTPPSDGGSSVNVRVNKME
jgi:hypothetical protein